MIFGKSVECHLPEVASIRLDKIWVRFTSDEDIDAPEDREYMGDGDGHDEDDETDGDSNQHGINLDSLVTGLYTTILIIWFSST